MNQRRFRHNNYEVLTYSIFTCSKPVKFVGIGEDCRESFANVELSGKRCIVPVHEVLRQFVLRFSDKDIYHETDGADGTSNSRNTREDAQF